MLACKCHIKKIASSSFYNFPSNQYEASPGWAVTKCERGHFENNKAIHVHIHQEQKRKRHGNHRNDDRIFMGLWLFFSLFAAEHPRLRDIAGRKRASLLRHWRWIKKRTVGKRIRPNFEWRNRHSDSCGTRPKSRDSVDCHRDLAREGV